MVTESSHTRINTPACTLNTRPHTCTENQHSAQKVPLALKGGRERQRAIDHLGGRRAASSLCPGFSGIFLSLRENTEGRSLLFTQLAPWKGLLNMKYEESEEVGEGES